MLEDAVRLPSHSISGIAVRSLFARAGRFEEFVSLALAPTTMDRAIADVDLSLAGPGFELAGVKAYEFENVTTLDAEPVYSEFHPTSMSLAEFGQWYFDGNSNRDLVGAAESPVEYVETSSALDDDRFWKLIDVLGHAPSDEGVDRLVDALAARKVDVIARFSQALAEKLNQLDDPGNLCRSDGSQPIAQMSPDAFLYYRCAIVAAGRSAFERVLEHPGIDQEEWDGGAGELLLGVPERAIEEKTGREVVFVNSVSYETGSNRQAWNGHSIPPLGVSAPNVNTGDEPDGDTDDDGLGAARMARLEASLAALLAQLSPAERENMERSEQLARAWGVDPDESAPHITWFGARSLIAVAGGIVESVMLFGVADGPSYDSPSQARVLGRAHELARQRATSLGGEFHGHLEVMETHYSYPMDGTVVFQIDRKAAPGVHAYQERYFTP